MQLVLHVSVALSPTLHCGAVWRAPVDPAAVSLVPALALGSVLVPSQRLRGHCSAVNVQQDRLRLEVVDPAELALQLISSN